MTIAIINGPNLNLTGKREPQIYGTMSFDEFIPLLRRQYPDIEIVYHQSNHEGQLIDWLQDADKYTDGIILNAGGYTHTSIALSDTVAAIETPVIEVHISDIYQREPFRRHSYLTPVCKHSIIGHGLDGYKEAVELIRKLDVRC